MNRIIKLSSMLLALVMGMLIITSCGKVKDVEIANFNEPAKDEKIAVISVEGFGDIKVKLFPEYAPKGVENFITHAENGYYDELNFHEVVNNFMIQGGDPKGDGTGGESIWEHHLKLNRLTSYVILRVRYVMQIWRVKTPLNLYR